MILECVHCASRVETAQQNPRADDAAPQQI